MIKAMIIAGIGGFLGTCGRFLTGKLAQMLFATSFPLGTMAVNLAGCLLIGVLYGLAERHQLINAQMSLLLITGFCGGFTTFSTFANDGLLLLQNRHWLHVLLYVAGSVMLGILCVWGGRSWVK
jgi:CrcB protein